MPKRTDLSSICVFGAGPIVIGQACEFDYSGTQAIKALKDEGLRVTLINSNPATIMTDPAMADATYIEPLDADTAEAILERERPDAVLPTLGGQTALNLALELHERGVFERLGIELLGANPVSIRRAEDRQEFKALVADLGLESARSGVAHSLEEARQIASYTGLPCVLRPSFTLGGVGGGIVRTHEEFDERVAWALDQSPVGEVLIEESLLGWKEYEMEVMRDTKDRAIIICSIENLDPMGVHTGDSITVAPAQTLTDREYQTMRDASIRIIRAVGVETGGSNIQFAVDPATGRQVVIEMNPRVSRSSALASKATGFPIARIAALLAIGYTLDEITNSITLKTPACFEPALDYVVTKIPRFAFDKFPSTTPHLTTQMKSVGEVMAIGRTFTQSLLKALRSLETSTGSLLPPPHIQALDDDALLHAVQTPTPDRLHAIACALSRGHSVDSLYALSSVDPWFLHEMLEIIEFEHSLQGTSLETLTPRTYTIAKQIGLADTRIAQLLKTDATSIRAFRSKHNLAPVYKRVDTCAAEFEAHTPYLYSCWEGECEAQPDTNDRVIILGSGPNRIGQGIEFDYSCVKASWTARDMGLTSILVNCNPETVSTDHDISDRLYFEPLDLEAILDIVAVEQPRGVIVQLGGQTPLRLANALAAAHVPILGTPADVLDLAENRERFSGFAKELNLPMASHATAMTPKQAHSAAASLGFPVLVRPSNVLGGQAMEILNGPEALDVYLERIFLNAQGVAPKPLDGRLLPLLFDACLEGAIEVDVDAVCDGSRVVIGGVMEQVEPVGVHSGDSACWLPAPTLSADVQEALRDWTRKIALELGVCGLINIQFAVTGEASDEIVVIEVNPRASRTVPFVSKSVGVCMTTVATRVMLGEGLEEQGIVDDFEPVGWSCKEVVLPFSRFPGCVPTLRPEMRSTGEVMGLGSTPWEAFSRAQRAASNRHVCTDTILLQIAPGELQRVRPLLDEMSSTAKLYTLYSDSEELSDVLKRPVEALGEDGAIPQGAAVFVAAPDTPEDRADRARIFRKVLSAHCAVFTTPEAFQAHLVSLRENHEASWTPQSLQERLSV